MREVVLVNAFLGRDAAEYIRVVGNDGVNAAMDHIAHVFLVVYRPGVDLHAAAVVQIDQLRLILEQHIARVHVVRVGALDVLVDVEIRLVVEQAGLDVRAELFELLHGNKTRSCILCAEMASMTRCSRPS